MSDEDIAIETESYSGVVWEIRNGKRGIDIELVIPDNLSYILKEYDPVDEKITLYSNIKYVIELSERGVIKASQVQIAKYFGESPSMVSNIKKTKILNERSQTRKCWDYCLKNITFLNYKNCV